MKKKDKTILGIDPGAKRLGYALIVKGKEPKRVASGILGLERKEDETYQEYKTRLIEWWIIKFKSMLVNLEPDEVWTEIVPAVGGGNFVVAAQSHLAATVATVIQTLCIEDNRPYHQVAANTVKKSIAGSGKATKVQVRNGVFAQIPSFARLHQAARKEGETMHSDETDALAIALYANARKTD